MRTCPVLRFEEHAPGGSVIQISAHANGRQVGVVEGIPDPEDRTVKIHGIHVNAELRRCGVGTMLYTKLAQRVCAGGANLVSDTIRQEAAEMFWRKQVAKGRAECIERWTGRAWSCKWYKLKCPVTSLQGTRR